MKTKLLLFVMLGFNLTFSQNQSLGAVSGFLIPSAPNEIFRFAPGLVTQLEAGNFNLINPVASRWFSIGGIQTSPPGQTERRAYGLRFQNNRRALTFGFQNVLAGDANPRIEWINTGLNSQISNSLEFRVANSFTSTLSTLVASMNGDGSTTFGDFLATGGAVFTPKVTIFQSVNEIGLNIEDTGVLTQGESKTGFLIQTIGSGSGTATGGDARINGTTSIGFGLKGSIMNSIITSFGAGIYGEALAVQDQWAGFFDGRVFASSYTRPSDKKLKIDIRLEQASILPRLMQLKPVTYKFIETKDLNLAKTLQHGFIAQDLEEVFPELVTEIKKPTFDEKGKSTGTFNFKAIEYEGMTSMLLAGMQEMHKKIEKLEEELAALRDEKSERKITDSTQKDMFMEQNTPNPFDNQTTIRYQLPEGTTSAEIMVFNLNGLLIKNYPINKNQSEITIKASDIGSGLFIYSLVQNGQELLSKKMIVK